MTVTTERLEIRPMTENELEKMICKFSKSLPELAKAYSEMLDGCLKHKDEYLWYACFEIYLKETNEVVGYIGFKGITEEKTVEIGYGIDDGYTGRGYATEAVVGLCCWAKKNGAKRIEAETENSNAASKRVLEKAGFVPTGALGSEGPRLYLK